MNLINIILECGSNKYMYHVKDMNILRKYQVCGQKEHLNCSFLSFQSFI